jgi:hypothetical protein
MLKYSVASSFEYNRNFTQYVRDFCTFTEPLDNASEAQAPSMSLEAKASKRKITLSYSIPASPGLVNITVTSTNNAKKTYSHTFMNAARQRSGKYFLSTGDVPTGQAYVVELKVGDKAVKKVVYVPKSG